MAKQEFLNVKVDYLSMVSENYYAEKFISRILQLPLEIFFKKQGHVQYKAYTTHFQCGGINVFGDVPPSEENPQGLGCYLVVSGGGCTDFFNNCYAYVYDEFRRPLVMNYGAFFRWCNEPFLNLNYHLTRLDTAIDDRNPVPFFTIEQLYRKCEKDEFISTSRNFQLIKSTAPENQMAHTLYIGENGSDVRYRFYDKDLEQCTKYEKTLADVGSWKRTEIQFRNEKADLFEQKMAETSDEFGRLISDFLGTNLRFIVPDSGQANRSRWRTCRFWERFLGKVEPLKIQVSPTENSLYDTQKWLKEGGGLSAIKLWLFLQEYDALGDMEDLATLMHALRYSSSLSSRAAAHLSKIGRQELLPLIYENTRDH